MDAIAVPQNFLRSNIRRLFLLTGLDLTNDRFHADIANAFLKTDDSISRYELLSAQHQIFDNADKAALRPNVGILRLSWIEKYALRRPAVVLIFVELEWDHPNFVEKKAECKSKIDALKDTIGCSEVRYLLILIQRKPSTSPAGDRASDLCNTCGLLRTQLTTLSVMNGVQNESVASIKRAVSEFSQQFYQEIYKKIRNRRVPENHPNLSIRNQFKQAFISELRNDLASAMRFYKLAFDKLVETNIADENKYEYLTIVSLINYKICELYFSRGNAVDAVEQFSKHEDRFMNRRKFLPGSYPSGPLATIEITKWCMNEYAMFGQLFIKSANSVVLNTSVNPGKYFNTAAEFSEIANQLVNQLRQQTSTDYEVGGADILHPSTPLIFLGQRPWRPNVSLADLSVEHRARMALEKSVACNYDRSVDLFQRAIGYFYKIERCQRQKRVSELQLAFVFTRQKNYEAALEKAQDVFRSLRDISIYRFYPPIYTLLYELYFVQVDPAKFLQVCLEMMNPDILNSSVCTQLLGAPEEAANHLFVCFQNISNGLPPPSAKSFISFLSTHEWEEIMTKWSLVLRQPCRIDATFLDSFVTARGFIQSVSEICSNEYDTWCEVRINNAFIEPVSVLSAMFKFDIFTPSSQAPVEYASHAVTNFRIESDQGMMFRFPLKPAKEEANFAFDITLASIELQITPLLSLCFDNRQYGFSRFANTSQLLPRETVRIMRTEYPLEVASSPEGQLLTPLRDELTTLNYDLRNNGTFQLTNLRLHITRTDGEPSQIAFHNSVTNNAVQGKVDWEMKDRKIEPAAVITVPLEAKFVTVGEQSYEIEVTASVLAPCPFYVKKRFSLIFHVREPFTASVKLQNSEGNAADSLLIGETAQTEVTFKAETDCTVLGHEFSLTDGLSGSKREVQRIEMCEGDSATLSCLISVDSNALLSMNRPAIGRVKLFWRRGKCENEATFSHELGNVSIVKNPIALTIDLGEGDHVIHKEIHVTIGFTNLQSVPRLLKMVVQRSDVFMFAGTNEVPISLEPGQTQHRTLSLVANVTGELPFPRVTIECVDDPEELISKYVAKMLPKTILVLPTSKISKGT